MGEGEEVTTFQEIWWLAFGNSCAEYWLRWRTPHHGGRLARERRGANAAGNQTSTRPDLDLLARSTAGYSMPSKLLAVHAVCIPISSTCRLFGVAGSNRKPQVGTHRRASIHDEVTKRGCDIRIGLVESLVGMARSAARGAVISTRRVLRLGRSERRAGQTRRRAPRVADAR